MVYNHAAYIYVMRDQSRQYSTHNRHLYFRSLELTCWSVIMRTALFENSGVNLGTAQTSENNLALVTP